MRLPLLWRVSVPGALVRGAVWAFLAAALVWTVGCKFYGVVANKDECYMALCCRGWGEQPVAMLSFFTGWIAMRVFGDQVITLRLLAMACYLVAILMPVWYFTTARATGCGRSIFCRCHCGGAMHTYLLLRLGCGSLPV